MAPEKFSSGAGIGNTAQAIGLADADPVVDHHDPQFIVYRDVHFDPAGMSVTSAVGQSLSQDSLAFDLHLQGNLAIDGTVESNGWLEPEAFGGVRHRLYHPGPHPGARR
jgi:hypothetical protein